MVLFVAIDLSYENLSCIFFISSLVLVRRVLKLHMFLLSVSFLHNNECDFSLKKNMEDDLVIVT